MAEDSVAEGMVEMAEDSGVYSSRVHSRSIRSHILTYVVYTQNPKPDTLITLNVHDSALYIVF